MGAQTCFVCGAAGILAEDHILLPPGDRGAHLIGQCPRCHRFICSRHAELLDLGGRRGWFSRKPKMLTACCPFDPEVPLGTPAPGRIG